MPSNFSYVCFPVSDMQKFKDSIDEVEAAGTHIT